MTDYCFIECVMMSSGRGVATVWVEETLGLETDVGRDSHLVEIYSIVSDCFGRQ